MIISDTLCLPESSSLTAKDFVSFDDCSFFRGDTLLHNEVPYHPFGFAVTATPFRLSYDGWSGLLLLIFLLFAVSLVLRLRKKFHELFRGVFFPTSSNTKVTVTSDPLRYSTRLLAICLLSLTAAMVTFAYVLHDIGYYPFSNPPYILFVFFFFLWLVYFVLKRLMSGFVNWIFFCRKKIFTWQRANTFLFVAEAIFFLVLAIAVMFLPIPPSNMLLLALFFVAFVKIVLLFRTYQIFFSKIYGILHLIVYFCTLELMPLFVLQQILKYDAWLSMVKL